MQKIVVLPLVIAGWAYLEGLDSQPSLAVRTPRSGRQGQVAKVRSPRAGRQKVRTEKAGLRRPLGSGDRPVSMEQLLTLMARLWTVARADGADGAGGQRPYAPTP